MKIYWFLQYGVAFGFFTTLPHFGSHFGSMWTYFGTIFRGLGGQRRPRWPQNSDFFFLPPFGPSKKDGIFFFAPPWAQEISKIGQEGPQDAKQKKKSGFFGHPGVILGYLWADVKKYTVFFELFTQFWCTFWKEKCKQS